MLQKKKEDTESTEDFIEGKFTIEDDLMIQKKKEDTESTEDFIEGKFTIEDDASTPDTLPNTNCACFRALFSTITRKTTQPSAAAASSHRQ